MLTLAVQNDFVWRFLDATVNRAHKAISWRRTIRANEEAGRVARDWSDNAIAQISPDLKVKNGPFIGMQYVDKLTIGSTLLPKLLGSYERELQPLIEQMCAKPYGEIVNIGCAEGYYSVGLAMRMPMAKIYAYDVNPQAIELCRRMAVANGVADRLIPGGLCNEATLRAIPFSGQALIICDCEGYEKTLFSADIPPFLSRHEILVEVHDFIDIEISSVIKERFVNTHNIQSIFSTDDIVKAHTYRYAELTNFNLAERRKILAERRPTIMEWLYLTPRLV